MLKLMYITNNPEIATVAENAGVDRIFVDMEYIGKDLRQTGLDTVQNHHDINDVRRIKTVVKNSQVVVRVNPIHDATDEYSSSKQEIDSVIEAGADVVMLPYFQTVEEVKKFIRFVDGRATVMLLLESLRAVELIDEILEIPGIDEIHIGLNDLSLDMGKKFLFEILADGTVEYLCKKIRNKGIAYGFGGIGRIGHGDLPAEYIIKEHYRLGSTGAILSRSFCNAIVIEDIEEIRVLFNVGIQGIRNLEEECLMHQRYFTDNVIMLKDIVKVIADKK